MSFMSFKSTTESRPFCCCCRSIV